MNMDETRAILTISLLAAFADGDKHDRERAEVKRIAQALSEADGINLPTLTQDVLMKRVTVASAASHLQSPEARMLAYEMALSVCDADGAHSTAESAFLADLKARLQLEKQSTTDAFESAASAMAAATSPSTVTATAVGGAGVVAGSVLTNNAGFGRNETMVLTPAAGTSPALSTSNTTALDAELDAAIVKAAIVNGALELLPETLSSMAIIPLQIKLVYNIGKSYGYELDTGHIKDFLATVGVGLTSQYLEQAGRKLLGGLLGRVGGGLARGVGNQAVSSGMSFAATYALGLVAKRYYAGGRTFSTQMLKESYAQAMQEAKGLQGKYLPAMQEQAKSLDTAKIMAMVRGR